MNPETPFYPAGFCPHCGYAINPGRCPECGRDVPPKRLAKSVRAHKRYVRKSLVVVSLLGILAALFGIVRSGAYWKVLPNALIVALDKRGLTGAREELFLRLSFGGFSTAEVIELISAAPSEVPLEVSPTYASGHAAKVRFFWNFVPPGMSIKTGVQRLTAPVDGLTLEIDGVPTAPFGVVDRYPPTGADSANPYAAPTLRWHTMSFESDGARRLWLPPLRAGRYNIAVHITQSLMRDGNTYTGGDPPLHTWTYTAVGQVLFSDDPAAATATQNNGE